MLFLISAAPDRPGRQLDKRLNITTSHWQWNFLRHRNYRFWRFAVRIWKGAIFGRREEHGMCQIGAVQGCAQVDFVLGVGRGCLA